MLTEEEYVTALKSITFEKVRLHTIGTDLFEALFEAEGLVNYILLRFHVGIYRKAFFCPYIRRTLFL